MLSFGLTHYFDGFDVWGYHLVNTIIHIATAISFYFVAQLTLTLPAKAGRYKFAREIALTTALLRAVHPLQTNAVTYIVQRMTSMGALFYLLALYCYIRARIKLAGMQKVLFFALSCLWAFMEILSKENSGMFPVIIIFYELIFLNKPGVKLLRQKKLIILSLGGVLLFAVFC